jgi:hypothetical protein
VAPCWPSLLLSPCTICSTEPALEVWEALGTSLAPFGTSFPFLPVPQDAFVVQEQSIRDAQPVATCQLPPVSDYQKLISKVPHGIVF